MSHSSCNSGLEWAEAGAAVLAAPPAGRRRTLRRKSDLLLKIDGE
jgi:hypothetical protein